MNRPDPSAVPTPGRTRPGSAHAWRALALIAWLSLLCPADPIPAAELAVGEKAPDFTLQGSDGSNVSLAQFIGKRDLVLAWFPKAFTPG
jgi:hypothetical protein